MFCVRLLFLSILLYYTEAGGFNDSYYVGEIVNIPRSVEKAVENTTTKERPYIPGWSNWGWRTWAYYTTSTTEDSDTKTTERPYIPGWHTWEPRPEAYYTTSTEESPYWGDISSYYKTTTEDSPYWGDVSSYYKTTTENSAYWGNRTSYYTNTTEAYWGNRTYTTTTEDSPYWGNRTSYYTTTSEDSPYWGNRTYTTTTEDSPYWGNISSYYTTSTTEDSDTTTTRRPYVICHRGHNSTVGSRCPTSTDGPIKISINSSVNTNGTGNYVGIADFLKKLTGAMLSSASNIAPNSNITNLAVANGNGNMFFYVYN